MSSNHIEIFALYEAAHECIWLRVVVEHIQSACGLLSIFDVPTTILGDNSTRIAEHIALKFFFFHQQQKHQDQNQANLFRKQSC